MDGKDLRLSPEEWRSLLVRYGIPASSLTGKGAPCPLCSPSDRRSDRFTFDNKRGRGDWVCRGCGVKGRAAGEAGARRAGGSPSGISSGPYRRRRTGVTTTAAVGLRPSENRRKKDNGGQRRQAEKGHYILPSCRF